MYYSGKFDEEEWLPEDHLEDSEELDEDLYSYTAGEYKYRYCTDDRGRIIRCVADPLRFTKRDERLEHDQNTLGKLEGDQAGHLIADRFGGSPNLDNLVIFAGACQSFFEAIMASRSKLCFFACENINRFYGSIISRRKNSNNR